MVYNEVGSLCHVQRIPFTGCLQKSFFSELDSFGWLRRLVHGYGIIIGM